MEALIEFLDFLTPYGPQSYGVMFIVLLACGFGFPMPEDVVLISGGVLSARGVCNLWITNLVCFAGVLIGDGTVFTIGRVMGPRVRKLWLFRRLLNDKRNEQVQKIVTKFGDKVVFVARFLPGLRTPIFLTVGMYRVSYWKFIILDGFAALISVPVWIYVGFLFGDNLELLEAKMHRFQAGMVVTVIAIAFIFLLFYWLKVKLIEKNPS